MSETATLSRETLSFYLKDQRLAVIATASPESMPEAALINIAVADNLDILFETTSATRKFRNLMLNPVVSLVVGWSGNRTLQIDGTVEELDANAYERLVPVYHRAYPEKASHEGWPGNSYFRVRPHWFRLSDYNRPRCIEELELPAPVRRRPGLGAKILHIFRPQRVRV